MKRNSKLSETCREPAVGASRLGRMAELALELLTVGSAAVVLVRPASQPLRWEGYEYVSHERIQILYEIEWYRVEEIRVSIVMA